MAIAAMYLKLSGVTGEALADDHVGEIELVSWDWGLLSGSHLSDGTPRSAPVMEAVNCRKHVDRATPTLFQFCDQHKVVSNATLTVTKAGGQPLPYVSVEMTNVRIIKVDVHSEEAELVEQVTLSCETLTFNYTPQSSSGAQASAPISYTSIHPWAQ